MNSGNTGPLLSGGSTGDDVRRVQRLLVMMRLLDYTGIDGVFGSQTTASVRTFQQSRGLTADGVVGPATWSAFPADPRTPQLAAGSSGPAISSLQSGLLAYGGAGSAIDPGPIDGIFGPRTTAAVQAYQSARGTTADGIVGDATWWIPAGAAGATLAFLAGATTV